MGSNILSNGAVVPKYRRELPSWALPVSIAACIAVLAFFGWRMFGGSGEVGPSKHVHAGMYDVLGEARKAQAARSQQSGTQTK